MNPRNEPLLWLQLVALGAMPLELLLLLLVLAGADPGPLPGLERVLVWGLGVVAPGLLLWRRPADCGSLLLVQVPAAGRSSLLRHLNALQQGWPPRILLPFGAALLLAALWTVDSRAALAAPLSPLDGASRLVTLILAIPLLAVLLWQWQQLGQALWLLSLSPQRLDGQDSNRGSVEADGTVLSLGLPLLLLAPLQATPQSARSTPQSNQDSPLQPSAEEPSGIPAADTLSATADLATAVEPEQSAEQREGANLDQQVD